MSRMPTRWPCGTGQWERTRTLVMGRDHQIEDEDTLVVGTPLDLITRLEDRDRPIGTVVLAGPFAALAAVLRELYPGVGVIEA
jgi:hypothetical protein